MKPQQRYDDDTPVARLIATEGRLSRLEEGQGRLEQGLERVEVAVGKIADQVTDLAARTRSLAEAEARHLARLKWFLGVAGAVVAALAVRLVAR